MKLPALQFYVGDWQKDLNLRRCSHGAKGVWIDTLCLMHESGERGVLITGTSPWSEEDWAAAVGGNKDVTLNLIGELLAKGVVRKRESDGAFYSARMVRDEEKRSQLRTRVRNYRERNASCNAPETKKTLLHEDEDEREESSSLGGSSEGAAASLLLQVPSAMELADEIYRCYPKRVKRPSAIRAILRAMKTYDSVMLRERTLAYAKAVTEAGYQYVPHPATWFNDEQFNDDPKTWTGTNANNGKPNQPNPRNIGIPAGAEGRNQARVDAIARKAAAANSAPQ